MIFPGSRIWHEGAASDLAVITDEIKMASFSGHIVLEFQESLDLVIVSEGEFLKVIEKIGRRILTTKKYREIWGKCQIKQGRMTIFELPPPLAESLKRLCQRRLVCTGAYESCDIGQVIREQKKSGLTGFIDCIGSSGKGLMQMERGVIVSCYYTEFHGLGYVGMDAFRQWHHSLVQAEEPYSLFVSDFDDGNNNHRLWESLLSERLEEVKLPLPSSTERLDAAFGTAVPEGELIFSEGRTQEKAFHIIEGTVELSRRSGGRRIVLGHLGAGSTLGLSWLDGVMPPPLTCTAITETRLLSFDRLQLDRIIYNHPAMAATLIEKASVQLRSVKHRLDLFRHNPRLKDLESYVLQVLNDRPDAILEGLPPGELFQQLSHLTPYSLPQMDQMVRELASAGRIQLDSGKVKLQPEEL
jgi:CRP-like cAMP-binding protein